MFIKEYFNLVFTGQKFDDAAFPQIIDHEEGTILIKGLTKREYFAAMAMQALLSDPNISTTYSHYAENAVQAADALIAALNK
jgi:hypothetical protein